MTSSMIYERFTACSAQADSIREVPDLESNFRDRYACKVEFRGLGHRDDSHHWIGRICSMADALNLWLGRHGEAVDVDMTGTDFDRTLTPYGRQQVAQTARWLLSREQAPELVLHSPLVRARQTAEVIANEISGGAVLMEESLLAPGFSTIALLNRLAISGVNKVVCIGHQPDIGRSLAEMTGGGRSLVPPGTLAAIDFYGRPTLGAGSLRWLIDPYLFGT